MAGNLDESGKGATYQFWASLVVTVVLGVVAFIGIISVTSQFHNLHGPSTLALNLAGWGTLFFLGSLGNCRHAYKNLLKIKDSSRK